MGIGQLANFCRLVMVPRYATSLRKSPSGSYRLAPQCGIDPEWRKAWFDRTIPARGDDMDCGFLGHSSRWRQNHRLRTRWTALRPADWKST